MRATSPASTGEHTRRLVYVRLSKPLRPLLRGLPRPARGSRNDGIVMLSVSETSPGKAKPADLIYYRNIYSAVTHPSGRSFAGLLRMTKLSLILRNDELDVLMRLFYAVSEFRGGKSDGFFERGRKMRFARIREFFRYFFYA